MMGQSPISFHSVLLILAWLFVKDAETTATFYNTFSYDAFYKAVKTSPYFSGLGFLGKLSSNSRLGHWALQMQPSLTHTPCRLLLMCKGLLVSQQVTHSFCAQLQLLLTSRHLHETQHPGPVPQEASVFPVHTLFWRCPKLQVKVEIRITSWAL